MEDAADKDNIGLTKRRHFLTNGRTLDMIGHVYCDVFNHDKFLINGVEAPLRFIKLNNTFCLMETTETNTDFNILEATLYVGRVKISPSILSAYSSLLSKTTAKYPLS